MPEPLVVMQRSVRFNRAPPQIAGAIDYIPSLEIDLAALGPYPAEVRVPV